MIFDLLQRSIKNPPLAEGSTARIHELDNPALKNFVLKVMNEVLTPEGEFTDAVSPQSFFYPLRTGFAGAEVGQILLAHESRRLFILPRIKGMTLEAQLAECIKSKGDPYEGAMDFLDKLIHVPAKGYKSFMQDLLLATRLNCGMDIYGENILINGDRLHVTDMDVMLKYHFKPEHVNFIDAILFKVHAVIEDNIPRPDPAKELLMDERKEMLRRKLEHVAGQIGFPLGVEDVTQWVGRQQFHSRGVLAINQLKTSLGKPEGELPKILERTIQFNQAVG